MTSDRQQRANRANARSSTGPKTVAGKARAARNTFPHGLNVPVLSVLRGRLRSRRAQNLWPLCRAERLEHARQIAETQVDLNRVRGRRRRLITGFLTDPKYQPLKVLRQQLRLMKTIDRVERLRGDPFKIREIQKMNYPGPLEGDEKLAAIIEDGRPACRA